MSKVRMAESVAAAQVSKITVDTAFRRWRNNMLQEGDAGDKDRSLLYISAWQRVPDELKQAKVAANDHKEQYNAIMDALRESGALAKVLSLHEQRQLSEEESDVDSYFMLGGAVLFALALLVTYCSVVNTHKPGRVTPVKGAGYDSGYWPSSRDVGTAGPSTPTSWYPHSGRY